MPEAGVRELVGQVRELIEDRERMRLNLDKANSERRRQVKRHHEAREALRLAEARVRQLEDLLKAYEDDEVCPYDCDHCHGADCPCDRGGCDGAR